MSYSAAIQSEEVFTPDDGKEESESDNDDEMVWRESIEKDYDMIRDKKVVWTQPMTNLFIELYSNRLDKFRNPVNKKRDIYHGIAIEMESLGFPTSADDCDRKMRNLKNYFLNIRERDSPKLESSIETDISWPYYEMLYPIFKDNSSKKMKYKNKRNDENDSDNITCDNIQNCRNSNVLLEFKRIEGKKTKQLKAIRENIESQNDKQRKLNETLERILTSGIGLDNQGSEDWYLNMEQETHQKLFRMSSEIFGTLQAEINYFEHIENEEADRLLLATLWFLGSSDNLVDIGNIFNIDLQAQLKEQLERILLLSSTYLQWPSGIEADLIDDRFTSLYKFPGVIGVLGCAYIEIDVQSNALREEYYNSQVDKYVIILQAVSDCNHLFRHVSIGFPGSLSISSVLYNSPLYTILNDEEESLVNSNKHLIGGTEHPQMKTLLTPYKNSNLNEEQHNFNLLHGSIVSVIERTFLAMGNRFPRLNFVDNFNPDLATVIISTICILYNFTIVKHDNCDLYN